MMLTFELRQKIREARSARISRLVPYIGNGKATHHVSSKRQDAFQESDPDVQKMPSGGIALARVLIRLAEHEELLLAGMYRGGRRLP